MLRGCTPMHLCCAAGWLHLCTDLPLWDLCAALRCCALLRCRSPAALLSAALARWLYLLVSGQDILAWPEGLECMAER